MQVLVMITGLVLIMVVLWDAFETVVLPRRVTRRLRLVRLFYRVTWPLWRRTLAAFFPRKSRENILSYYGPLSFVLLLALWGLVLILGFGLIYYAEAGSLHAPEGIQSLGVCLYLSGTTFFTLGLGDIQPVTTAARITTVLEAGTGFAFLAMMIGYLPSLQQSFSRREVTISLLDARAGSPPTAFEILHRHGGAPSLTSLTQFLHEWERWSAELLESHLSFPMLVYFRSQHDNQSWLAALTAILDASALVIAGLEGECVRQARLTFALARHTLVDLALVLYAPPVAVTPARLPDSELKSLRQQLEQGGLRFRSDDAWEAELRQLQEMYEPYLAALSRRLLMPLPPWILTARGRDNWQVSAWGTETAEKKHF